MVTELSDRARSATNLLILLVATFVAVLNMYRAPELAIALTELNELIGESPPQIPNHHPLRNTSWFESNREIDEFPYLGGAKSLENLEAYIAAILKLEHDSSEELDESIVCIGPLTIGGDSNCDKELTHDYYEYYRPALGVVRSAYSAVHLPPDTDISVVESSVNRLVVPGMQIPLSGTDLVIIFFAVSSLLLLYIHSCVAVVTRVAKSDNSIISLSWFPLHDTDVSTRLKLLFLASTPCALIFGAWVDFNLAERELSILWTPQLDWTDWWSVFTHGQMFAHLFMVLLSVWISARLNRALNDLILLFRDNTSLSRPASEDRSRASR